MTSILIVKDWNFEEYYQQSLDYLHAKYFSHPDVLSEVNLSESELCQLSYSSALGCHQSQSGSVEHGYFAASTQ